MYYVIVLKHFTSNFSLIFNPLYALVLDLFQSPFLQNLKYNSVHLFYLPIIIGYGVHDIRGHIKNSRRRVMYVLISERWGKDRTCINHDKLI